MRWSVIAVGKPSLPWAKSGIADYLTRLSRTGRVECIYLRDGTPEQVTQRMLDASEGSLRVLLDERGHAHRSVELAAWIKAREMEGCKHVSLLIGGANGHSQELRKAVRESWTLSPMTLQHELALVVLLEQIYRAYSILRGEPYHRE
jgi:23S rRNA (pseudouridine1915-N3)-methyltransferase